jgi:hypothetical protein
MRRFNNVLLVYALKLMKKYAFIQLETLQTLVLNINSQP